MAATLLLPNAELGKMRFNTSSIVLIDAFAAIAQSTGVMPGTAPPVRAGAPASLSRIRPLAGRLLVHRAGPAHAVER